ADGSAANADPGPWLMNTGYRRQLPFEIVLSPPAALRWCAAHRPDRRWMRRQTGPEHDRPGWGSTAGRRGENGRAGEDCEPRAARGARSHTDSSTSGPCPRSRGASERRRRRRDRLRYRARRSRYGSAAFSRTRLDARHARGHPANLRRARRHATRRLARANDAGSLHGSGQERTRDRSRRIDAERCGDPVARSGWQRFTDSAGAEASAALNIEQERVSGRGRWRSSIGIVAARRERLSEGARSLWP